MRKRRERVEKWRQEQKSGGLKKTETEDGGEDADDEEKPRKVWSLEDDDDDDEGGRSSYANIPHAWLSGTSDLLDLFCWEVVNCLWITFECNFGFEKKAIFSSMPTQAATIWYFWGGQNDCCNLMLCLTSKN